MCLSSSRKVFAFIGGILVCLISCMSNGYFEQALQINCFIAFRFAVVACFVLFFVFGLIFEKRGWFIIMMFFTILSAVQLFAVDTVILVFTLHRSKQPACVSCIREHTLQTNDKNDAWLFCSQTDKCAAPGKAIPVIVIYFGVLLHCLCFVWVYLCFKNLATSKSKNSKVQPPSTEPPPSVQPNTELLPQMQRPPVVTQNSSCPPDYNEVIANRAAPQLSIPQAQPVRTQQTNIEAEDQICVTANDAIIAGHHQEEGKQTSIRDLRKEDSSDSPQDPTSGNRSCKADIVLQFFDSTNE